MAGFGHPEILDLLREVWQKPSYPVFQRVGQRLAGMKMDGVAEHAERRRVRLAILSSFTIDPIVSYIRVNCLERDILPEIFVHGFNQFAQQLLDPRSELYAFRPDICYLHVLPEALVAGSGSVGLKTEHVQPLLDTIGDLIAAFRGRCQGDLVISNFAAPIRFPYSLQGDETAGLYDELNRQLEELVGKVPGVHVLDYDTLAAFHGKGAISDERLRHLARMELSTQMLPKLANKMLAYVIALRGFGRKCIVLDLDNILWGGIVGEEGIKGIQLGPEYPGSAFVEFQQSLLSLSERGILLAINSKNNERDALAVLEQHPAMVLRPEHFAAMRINWDDKCRNIEAIAAEMNLGLEPMVFIDDSPAERELMRRLRPEVFTPEWPTDPVHYRDALESLCDFATLNVTTEDLHRGEMYAAEGKREKLRKRSGTMEDYLFGLRMEIQINEATATDVPRVFQLTQKTNQFNLTTRRYSPAQIESFMGANDAWVYVLRNQDVFGDNGLVGIAIVIKEERDPVGQSWRIDSFLMSCRVLGRTIESAFLHYLINEAKRGGARYIVGEFVATGKNTMVKDFYSDAGFQPVEISDTKSRWILDLANCRSAEFPWLSINSGVGIANQSGGGETKDEVSAL